MGLVSLIALGIAGSILVVLPLRWRFARKALAASLVGEITEILTVIEAHDLPEAIRATKDDGVPFCGVPPVSSLIYRTCEGRIGTFTPHIARLIASFYSSAATLSQELHALEVEQSRDGRKHRAKFALNELEQLFNTGDAALRCLRQVIQPNRIESLIRA